MPYKVSKTKKGDYSVKSPHGTKSKGTSKKKAEAQARLLRGIEHDEDFAARVRRRNGMDD